MIVFNDWLAKSKCILLNFVLGGVCFELDFSFIPRNKLQLNKEEMLEKMKDWEQMNVKLKSDLGNASEQLLLNCDELANSKMELQRRRNEINVRLTNNWTEFKNYKSKPIFKWKFCLQKLNEDICRLSTLCAQNRKSATQSLPQDVILNVFKNWQENKEISDLDLLVRANEVSVLFLFHSNAWQSSRLTIRLPSVAHRPNWSISLSLAGKRFFKR